MTNTHTLTYSAELEDLPLPQDATDCRRLPSASETLMPQEYCKSTGQTCQSMTTCEHSQENDMQGQLLLPEASRVSHSVLPGSEQARKMTASSGRRWFPLLSLSGRLGLLVRMCLGSSRWGSTHAFLTWNVLVTPAKRSVFQLVPSGPDISDNESGLWPTPNATAFKGGRLIPRKDSTNGERNNWQDFCSLVLGHRYPVPELTERIMGYTEGWTQCTEIKHAETR